MLITIPKDLFYTQVLTEMMVSLGGVNPFMLENDVQTDLVERFHPVNNSWSTLTRLPEGRHHHGAVFLAGNIYVIGKRSIIV